MRYYAGITVLVLFCTTNVRAQRRISVPADHVNVRIDADVGGPALLAVGDSLSLSFHRYGCAGGDDCDLFVPDTIPTAQPRWQSSNLSVATIDRAGRVFGHTKGSATILAIAGRDTARVTVRVLAPVKDIRFAKLPRIPRVGDTLHVVVIARDSAGRTVARIAPVAHIMGRGSTGEVGWQDGSGRTRVFIDHSGLSVLWPAWLTAPIHSALRPEPAIRVEQASNPKSLVTLKPRAASHRLRHRRGTMTYGAIQGEIGLLKRCLIATR